MPKIDHGNGTDSEDGCSAQKPSRSWKSILDEKLHRLHSLQFGAENALDKGDAETALTLNLCLLGFLESECRTPEDRTFISPIIRETKQRIDAAREKVAASIDRNTFEQANCKESIIFKKSTGLDLGKIMESKYFLPHLNMNAKSVKTAAMESTEHEKSAPASRMWKEKRTKMDLQDDSNLKSGKNLTQCKLTSLYGNGSAKSTATISKQYANTEEKRSTQDIHSNVNLQGRNVESSYGCVDQEDEKNYSTAAKRQKASHPAKSLCFSKSANITDSIDIKDQDSKPGGFVTAKQKWAMDSLQKKGGSTGQNQQPSSPTYGGHAATSYHVGGNVNRTAVPKSLGMSRRGVRGNFIPPVRSGGGGGGYATNPCNSGADNVLDDSTRRCLELLAGPDGELPDKLRNLEPRLIEHISNEIMDQDPNVRWDDIAGLEHAKKCVTEMVIWPLLRPDIFQGCRSPGKGLLLFGPPGTGKTMIGKAIAGEAKATFFSISASSLTSKWIGEGEKLVRALFGVASCRQPAVIFIDEIDSLLSQRKSDGEHESSRRLKTQFLIEMEGCGSGNDQLLLIGATNRPQELDEAARRRLSKRLYIPLPSAEARAWIVCNLLKKDGLFTLSEDDIHQICDDTEGYSGSDMSNLVKEASMGPLREALMQGTDINKLKKEEMRPVMLQDFKNAVLHVKPSVSQTELGIYEDWNRQFGSHSL